MAENQRLSAFRHPRWKERGSSSSIFKDRSGNWRNRFGGLDTRFQLVT